MTLKPWHPAALAAALLLSACAPRTPRTDPAYTTRLSASGVDLTVAARTAEAGETTYQDEDGETCTLPLLRCEGTTWLTFSDVPLDAVQLTFARPEGDGFVYYDTSAPVEKVDYLRTETGDGVQVWVDTRYSFLVTVTGDTGTDQLILDCREDG